MELTPGLSRLRRLGGSFGEADRDTFKAVLGGIMQFGAECLDPINARGDAQGCHLVDGRVQLPAGYTEAWASYTAQGWSTLEMPVEMNGQGLPLILAAQVQEIIDGRCAAFGMLPVLVRSAAKLVAAHAEPAIREVWLPRLCSGEWAATICISEADAGSDVPRLRTKAVRDVDGAWSITGEKMWISFGDHTLTPRIGHCLLARTEAGISLFLVPNVIDDDAGETRPNTISVRRIEEKMGLHGSPTCALGFDGAKGWLLGEDGQGLQNLFVMITNMRLSAGVQGVGIASAAFDVALDYAHERRQGGAISAPAVHIAEHADVQRMLLESASRVHTLRSVGHLVAVQADLAAHEVDPTERSRAQTLLQWLLPIFKTEGGRCGFDVSSTALQVLGGAGYTREWPVEQYLRDARIATIYEGTSGIQALDLLRRQIWRGKSAGLAIFLEQARMDLDLVAGDLRAGACACYELLQDAATRLNEMRDAPREAEAGAGSFLELAGLAATGWMATRLAGMTSDTPEGRRLSASGRYHLLALKDDAVAVHAAAVSGARRIDLFDSLKA
ncbi:acyl-CoA dehydrogenase family protein [Henriciella mobilis]|uniref:Acyl-CoA dehydrogenase n=1 Tax=Henriciella mobilis TaxID=2305467 RepID=A0A399R8L3_9PROT|nr:acyl-CoA dehydrogenase family protein [Henriciella mobilis]RIJ26821.1 acyl-CoA dehydrogenase [Henriciella mobilis]